MREMGDRGRNTIAGKKSVSCPRCGRDGNEVDIIHEEVERDYTSGQEANM